MKKGKFSGAGCQNMSKGKILLDRVIILSNFLRSAVYFLATSSGTGNHLKAKFWSRVKKFFIGTPPTNLGQIPPPHPTSC